MFVYRLSKSKYAAQLSGKGASLSNNRWNTKGTKMIYTAESRALAMSEVLVHLDVYSYGLSYVMLTIEIPDHLPVLEITDVPANWNVFPNLVQTQRMGDSFILDNKFAVAKVPSAVVQGDFNYLLNPSHPTFSQVMIIDCTPFLFDNRLF